MKAYTYVEVEVSGYWMAMISHKHRDIIDDYARRGYRYVGYIPTDMDTNGKLRSIDLIFEHDV